MARRQIFFPLFFLVVSCDRPSADTNATQPPEAREPKVANAGVLPGDAAIAGVALGMGWSDAVRQVEASGYKLHHAEDGMTFRDAVEWRAAQCPLFREGTVLIGDRKWVAQFDGPGGAKLNLEGYATKANEVEVSTIGLSLGSDSDVAQFKKDLGKRFGTPREGSGYSIPLARDCNPYDNRYTSSFGYSYWASSTEDSCSDQGNGRNCLILQPEEERPRLVLQDNFRLANSTWVQIGQEIDARKRKRVPF